MSRPTTFVFSLVQSLVLFALSQSAFSQNLSPQIVPQIPPHGAIVYCCAYMVLCEGASEYVSVKVTSAVSQEDACQKAEYKALQLCEKGIVDMYQLLLPPKLCMSLEYAERMEMARMSTMPAPPSYKWKVMASLCYCDGTIGATIPVVGNTRCEVMRDARELLCIIKNATHPCKRAYMKFCIVKTPCCTPCR
jgi:hypothetical protein